MTNFWRTILILTLLGTIMNVSAQNSDNRITVYAKDGSVFNGFLIREWEGGLEMLLSIGDTITLNSDFVKKSVSTADMYVYPKGKYHFKHGLYGDVSMAFMGSDQEGSFQFDLLAGYRIRDRVSLGFGLGFTTTDVYLSNITVTHDLTTPYGYARFYPGGKKRRFYLDAKLGYGFNTTNGEDIASGGMNFQPGLGWHFASKNNFKWYVGLTQFIFHTEGVAHDISWQTNSPITTEYDLWYNRTLLKFGLQFH